MHYLYSFLSFKAKKQKQEDTEMEKKMASKQTNTKGYQGIVKSISYHWEKF